MKTDTAVTTQLTHKQARAALLNARSTLERALCELDRFSARFEEAASNAEKSQVMNWTLHYLASNIGPNLRLDLIANAQADLARGGLGGVD